MARNDLTKEIINGIIIDIYKKNNDVSINELFNLVKKKLDCGIFVIIKRCGNLDNILKELNINIPKNYISSKMRKNISDGMKKSEKFQKMVHSKEHGKNISESQKNSEKFQIAVHSIERNKKISETKKKNVSLDDIGQNMLNKVKYEGNFSLSDFMLDNHRGFSGAVIKRVLRENNITIDDFAKSKRVEFIDRRFGKHVHVGINEKQILDSYQRELGLPIERQFYVSGFYLDGYVRKINKAIEVYEKHHFDKNGNLRIKDIIRENIIKNKLGCDLECIKDTSSTNIVNDNQKKLENK